MAGFARQSVTKSETDYGSFFSPEEKARMKAGVKTNFIFQPQFFYSVGFHPMANDLPTAYLNSIANDRPCISH